MGTDHICKPARVPVKTAAKGGCACSKQRVTEAATGTESCSRVHSAGSRRSSCDQHNVCICKASRVPVYTAAVDGWAMHEGHCDGVESNPQDIKEIVVEDASKLDVKWVEDLKVCDFKSSSRRNSKASVSTAA